MENLSQEIKKPELLAPAGTWETFTAVIDAGADAVYLGGKRFNMRMHRSNFNFDDEALEKATAYARTRGVKLYVTVNNLLSDEELPETRRFLAWLDGIGTDGIIIQDLGLLKVLEELPHRFAVHASVMMNVSNLDTIRFLLDRGVSRVVTSREMTLETIVAYRKETAMEFEYFIHGDMCYSQSGQCLYSGLLFGQSSNRGRCLKPCRWPWLVPGAEAPSHPFAVKDMSLLTHVRDLVRSGVDSFKIEGRMREPEYLSSIVRAYRDEIDRFLDDPAGYAADEETVERLHASRVREWGTAFAFGRADADYVDPRGVREPRQFSKAQKEKVLGEEEIRQVRSGLEAALGGESGPFRGPLLLSVTAPTPEHAQLALEAGADRVIAGGETYRPKRPWRFRELFDLRLQAGTFAKAGRKAEVLVRTPSVLLEREMGDFESFLDLWARNARGEDEGLLLMTGNLGPIACARRKKLPVRFFGDFSFNLYNHETAEFLAAAGLESCAVSPEAGCREVVSLGRTSPLPLEILVQGGLRGLVSDVPLRSGADSRGRRGFVLIDEAEVRHRVEIDQYDRVHLFLGNHVVLLPFLRELAAAGIGIFRIDGSLYEPKSLQRLTELYRAALDEIAAVGPGAAAAKAGSGEDLLRDVLAVMTEPAGAGALLQEAMA